jgi:hypothetical protein
MKEELKKETEILKKIKLKFWKWNTHTQKKNK